MNFSCDGEPAYFQPAAGNPIYRVPFGWVRNNFAALFGSLVGVVTEDFSAGLAINVTSGCLAEDYNPDEDIYELAVWGHGAH